MRPYCSEQARKFQFRLLLWAHLDSATRLSPDLYETLSSTCRSSAGQDAQLYGRQDARRYSGRNSRLRDGAEIH